MIIIMKNINKIARRLLALSVVAVGMLGSLAISNDAMAQAVAGAWPGPTCPPDGTLASGYFSPSAGPLIDPSINGGLPYCNFTINFTTDAETPSATPVSPFTCGSAPADDFCVILSIPGQTVIGNNPVPEMSDYLAMALILAAGGAVYYKRRRKPKTA